MLTFKSTTYDPKVSVRVIRMEHVFIWRISTARHLLDICRHFYTHDFVFAYIFRHFYLVADCSRVPLFGNKLMGCVSVHFTGDDLSLINRVTNFASAVKFPSQVTMRVSHIKLGTMISVYNQRQFEPLY
ncbi:hypothetical protein AC626_01900 [Pseudoalteromonas rubra]|uniref:Uncharacterized protein n=1 Tax=Pseudoalteromonas rubra TaxID=43658 RepID=A0A0L0EWU7_9GAMM|nr:hypothetical protein AC626_01900 [Pseudoalteromonas rubra]